MLRGEGRLQGRPAEWSPDCIRLFLPRLLEEEAAVGAEQLVDNKEKVGEIRGCDASEVW